MRTAEAPTRIPITTYKGQSGADFRRTLAAAGVTVQSQVSHTLLPPNGIYVSPETRNLIYEYSSGEIDGYRYEQFVTGYYQDLALANEMFAAVFAIELPQPTVPLYISSRTTINSILGFRNVPILTGIEHVQLEGDFSEFFTVYSRDAHALDAFMTIVPNLMLDILTSGSHYDIEFAGNYVYFYRLYSPTSTEYADKEWRSIRFSAQDYVAMRDFGLKYGAQFVRAARPSTGDSPADTQPLWQFVNKHQAINNKRQLWALAGVFAYLWLCYVAWFVVIPLSLVWFGIRWIQWCVRKKRLAARWAQQQY